MPCLEHSWCSMELFVGKISQILSGQSLLQTTHTPIPKRREQPPGLTWQSKMIPLQATRRAHSAERQRNVGLFDRTGSRLLLTGKDGIESLHFRLKRSIPAVLHPHLSLPHLSPHPTPSPTTSTTCEEPRFPP